MTEVSFNEDCTELHLAIHTKAKEMNLETGDIITMLCAYLGATAAIQPDPDEAIEDIIRMTTKYKEDVAQQAKKFNNH